MKKLNCLNLILNYTFLYKKNVLYLLARINVFDSVSDLQPCIFYNYYYYWVGGHFWHCFLPRLLRC